MVKNIISKLKNINHYQKNIKIKGIEKLKKIENEGPVIFISGHFSNFELMAMQIEKAGVDCAAIYRPLNNPYLNSVMERIRIRDICKKQANKIYTSWNGSKETCCSCSRNSRW